MSDPTAREIEACSDAPSRFKRMLPTALEVVGYSSTHGGRLPSFVFELSERKWDDLSATLVELDELEWLRRLAP